MLKYLEKNKKLLVYTPLLLYWLFILAATSYPSSSLPDVALGDKVNHFLAYFGLAVLLNLTLRFQNKYVLLKNWPSLFTLLLGTFYGMLDELHQILIPGRSCELLDWVADVTGLILGVAFIRIVAKLNFEPKIN